MFNQSGGAHNVGSNGLFIGYPSTTSQRHLQPERRHAVRHGSDLLSAMVGTGVFTQSGGTATLGQLYSRGVGEPHCGRRPRSTSTAAAPSTWPASLWATATSGTSTFNFNGGILQPTSSNGTHLLPQRADHRQRAQRRGGLQHGNGFNVTVAQGLVHSTHRRRQRHRRRPDQADRRGHAHPQRARTPTPARRSSTPARFAGRNRLGGGHQRRVRAQLGTLTLANTAGATLDQYNGFNTQIGSLTARRQRPAATSKLGSADLERRRGQTRHPRGLRRGPSVARAASPSWARARSPSPARTPTTGARPSRAGFSTRAR